MCRSLLYLFLVLAGCLFTSVASYEESGYLARLVERFDSLESERSPGKIQLSSEEIEEALRVGEEYVQQWNSIEARMMEDKKEAEREGFNSLATSRAANFRRFAISRPETMEESKKAAIALIARQYLSRKFDVNDNEIDFDEVIQKTDKAKQRRCRRAKRTCPPHYPFRSLDGTCNNLKSQPLFGKSFTIFQRMLTHPTVGVNYEDRVSTIRRAKVSKNPLPSARLVSTTVVVNDSVPNPNVALMAMQWGQFLDHDLTETPVFTNSDGSAIECCSSFQTGVTPSTPPHPECLPIPVPADDPKFNPSGKGAINCMNFVRSTFGNNLDGTTRSMRTQINALTHWMDGSMVYGSTAAEAAALRDTSTGKGKLKVTIFNGRSVLPPRHGCCVGDASKCSNVCFAAGDTRVNEHPLLTLMHLIWVREHNRVADEIVKIAPRHSDEFYYQQARRIVIAEIQHITYNEYLPVMIGPVLAAEVNSPQFSYRPGNPAIFHEFATAAFRIGHSMLRSFIRLFEKDGRNSKESYLLSDSFNFPARTLTSTFMDNAIRGLLQIPAQTVDNCFADDITSQLFKPKGKSLGLDLIALNIQRGRDHGIAPYAAMKYFLASNNSISGFLPSGFDSLVPTHSQEVISAFKSVYETVDDIDLFIGGVTEKPLPGAALGKTFAKMWALQFINLKRTDRFFYTYNTGPGSFTKNQLAEILKVSHARIICDNTDGTIKRIQPRIFNVQDELVNKPVPCRSLPSINFANMLPF